MLPTSLSATLSQRGGVVKFSLIAKTGPLLPARDVFFFGVMISARFFFFFRRPGRLLAPPRWKGFNFRLGYLSAGRIPLFSLCWLFTFLFFYAFWIFHVFLCSLSSSASLCDGRGGSVGGGLLWCLFVFLLKVTVSDLPLYSFVLPTQFFLTSTSRPVVPPFFYLE